MSTAASAKVAAMRRTSFALALAALALAFPAAAQNDFPSHAVTLTVGFVPGGAADLAARIVARKLAANLRQAVVVENRPGAGGTVAAHHIAAAPPDGYTISLSTVGALITSPVVNNDRNFDPKRDVAPITMAMTLSGFLVVNANSPVKTLGDLVALAKARPGEISYSTPGVGGVAHLRMELFQKSVGIKLVHVPYKGGGPEMTDLLGGRIVLSSATAAAVLPYIRTGKLRAIAATGPTRHPVMPDVPTAAESGYPDSGMEATNWYAFVAPPKTPDAILDFWNRELTRVLSDPAVKADLARYDLEARTGTREDLARSIARESDQWSRVVREAHIATQ